MSQITHMQSRWSSQEEPRLQLVQQASHRPCCWQDLHSTSLYLLLPSFPEHYQGENSVSLPCFTAHVFYIDWKVNCWEARSVFPLCIPKSEICSKAVRDWTGTTHLRKHDCEHHDSPQARCSVAGSVRQHLQHFPGLEDPGTSLSPLPLCLVDPRPYTGSAPDALTARLLPSEYP